MGLYTYAGEERQEMGSCYYYSSFLLQAGGKAVKLTISIPDSLGETLQAITPAGKSLSSTAEGLLAAFPVDLRERPVLITNSHRKTLEKLLAAPLPNVSALVERVQLLS